MKHYRSLLSVIGDAAKSVPGGVRASTALPDGRTSPDFNSNILAYKLAFVKIERLEARSAALNDSDYGK